MNCAKCPAIHRCYKKGFSSESIDKKICELFYECFGYSYSKTETRCHLFLFLNNTKCLCQDCIIKILCNKMCDNRRNQFTRFVLQDMKYVTSVFPKEDHD